MYAQPENAALTPVAMAKVGNTICFVASRHNFTIEEITQDAIGYRFHFNDGTASNHFAYGELVWVERESQNATR